LAAFVVVLKCRGKDVILKALRVDQVRVHLSHHWRKNKKARVRRVQYESKQQEAEEATRTRRQAVAELKKIHRGKKEKKSSDDRRGLKEWKRCSQV